MNEYKRDQEQLGRDLRDGLITQDEYDKQLRDMQCGYLQRRYKDEMLAEAEEAGLSRKLKPRTLHNET